MWVARGRHAEEEDLLLPFTLKPRGAVNGRAAFGVLADCLAVLVSFRELRRWCLVVRLEVDPHAVFHVEFARVELVLVVTGGLRILKIFSNPRQVVVGETRM